MERTNEHDLQFRHGDHGPKYLLRGPKHEWGIIVLKSGQAMGAHKHAEVEETFYFQTGTPQMLVDGVAHRVREGDVFRLEAGEAHDIVNDADCEARVVFIKCPYLPQDKIDL